MKGSKTVKVSDTVIMSCISEEARKSLEIILVEWVKHNQKRLKKFPGKRATIYSFAYWLIRWSGLFEPSEKLKERIK